MKQTMSRLDVLAITLPLGLIAALLTIYFINRDFYLTYILEQRRREFQAVEIMTLGFFACAVPLMIAATWRQFKRCRNSGDWMGLIVIGLVMGATIFAFGEEIDWGDTFFGWTREGGTMDEYYALNLHNNLPIRGIGSIFLVAVFFGLPVAWAMRERLRLPDGLRIAAPEKPVVFAMGVAFGWRLIKHIYLAIVGKENIGVYGDDGFYWGFVEQNNEQKEMLIALALLLYALYLVRTVRTDKTAPDVPA
jgi:hypothetical protein